jgi:hypothetical protein
MDNNRCPKGWAKNGFKIVEQIFAKTTPFLWCAANPEVASEVQLSEVSK